MSYFLLIRLLSLGAFSIMGINAAYAEDEFEAADEVHLVIEESIVLQGMSSAPDLSNSDQGRIYFDTNTEQLKFSFDGEEYEPLSDAGGEFDDEGESQGKDRTLGNVDNFDLSLKTNDTERLHIQNDGLIGIGTTNPQEPLHIVYSGVDGPRTNIGLLIENSSNAEAEIKMQTGGIGNPWIITADNDENRFRIWEGDEQRFIIRDGNTGIGLEDLETVDAKLHVKGTFKVADGSEGEAKVLTSDANGLASWQEVTLGAIEANSDSSFPDCNASISGTMLMDTSANSGTVYVCDTSRNPAKWLSMQSVTLWGDEGGRCDDGRNPDTSGNCNVDWGNGLGPGSNTSLGFYLPKPITITGYGFSSGRFPVSCPGGFNAELWGSGDNNVDNTYVDPVANPGSSASAVIASGLSDQTENANDLNIDIAGDQYVIWGIRNNCQNDDDSSADNISIDDWNLVLYYKWRHD